MRWTDRQQAMLAAMGLRQWAPAVGIRAEAMASRAAAPGPASASAFNQRSEAAAAILAAVDTAAEPAPPGHAPPRSVPIAAPGSLRAAGCGAMQAPLPVAITQQPDAADWQVMRAAVAACRDCGLCEGRSQTVFGAGHTDAPWLVVGEAPDEDEDRAGEPFVAGSGQLLDRMLAALGLNRSADGAALGSGRSTDGANALARRVYVTNVLKCRPPRNRAPSASELAACEPHLLRQIALLRPRLIVAMGRYAVQAMTRSDEPIGRLRGRVHSFHGVPLVVTYHPAYLQRSPLEKARAWEDLCLAATAFEEAAPQTLPAPSATS